MLFAVVFRWKWGKDYCYLKAGSATELKQTWKQRVACRLDCPEGHVYELLNVMIAEDSDEAYELANEFLEELRNTSLN